VTLFESEKTFGGHTLTDETIPGVPVDLGFQVQSGRRPPSFTYKADADLPRFPARAAAHPPPPARNGVGGKRAHPLHFRCRSSTARRTGTLSRHPPPAAARARAPACPPPDWAGQTRAGQTLTGQTPAGQTVPRDAGRGLRGERHVLCALRGQRCAALHTSPPPHRSHCPSPSKSQRTDTLWGNTLTQV
jgi:hypothetical protein